jgi:endonuclease YncB( thermonuclease family)
MPSRRLLVSAILALTYQVLLCTAEVQAQGPNIPVIDFTHHTPRKVVAVHQVNLIEVDLGDITTRIRLVGVASHPKDQGQATAFLKNSLAGESVYLNPIRDPNGTHSKGITQAFVYRAPDGLLLNTELLRQGYAVHDSRHRHRHMAVFAYYAAAAREFERGLWAPPRATTPLIRDADSPQPPSGNSTNSQVVQAHDEQVWITKSGTKYHRKDCSYHQGNMPILREEAKQRGLQPCKRCNPK